jgi:hypothetical protein
MKDAIDLANVQIHASPDVRSWPITSEITELGIHPGHLRLRHTKEGEWPDVPFDTALQESTLWVFLQIDGHWHGTGAERIRPNQQDKPEPDRVSQWFSEWLYDSNRWGPMTRYIPAPGELVGFMLTAGIQRSGDSAIVRERSAVVLVRYPGEGGGSFPPFASLEPPRPAEPPPVQQPAPVATTPQPPASAVATDPAPAGSATVILAKLEAIHDAIVKQSTQQHADAQELLNLLKRFAGR